MGLLGRAIPDDTVRYHFVVTGLGPSKPDVIVEGNTLRMEDAGDTTARVTVRCDTETYVLLVYGRLDLGCPGVWTSDDRGRSRAGPSLWPVVQGHLT